MKPSDAPLTDEGAVSPQLFRHSKVRIDIPSVLLADSLHSSQSRDPLAPIVARLVHEYSGAQGYVDHWGHVLERNTGPFLALTFVPVQLWESTTGSRHRTACSISALSLQAHHSALLALKQSLPSRVQLTGGATQGRRHPAALFGLVVPETDRPAFERWAEQCLLPGLLPEALAYARAEVVRVLSRADPPGTVRHR